MQNGVHSTYEVKMILPLYLNTEYAIASDSSLSVCVSIVLQSLSSSASFIGLTLDLENTTKQFKTVMLFGN